MFYNNDLYHQLLGHKPKVISLEEEPVAVMNAEGNFIACAKRVFDTGNFLATGISRKLVKRLNLKSNIDYTKTMSYEGVGGGDDGSQTCHPINIIVKIRDMTFPVKAAYGVTPEKIDLLIGRVDIIRELWKNGFTLGE